jgi:hypothetical protein
MGYGTCPGSYSMGTKGSSQRVKQMGHSLIQLLMTGIFDKWVTKTEGDLVD